MSPETVADDPPCPAHPPPTNDSRATRAQRTHRLLARIHASDDAEVRSHLIGKVVTLNMPVARAVAHRYHGRGVADDDLDQVAYLALVQAAQKYDPSHERDFLSYAVPTIRGELRKHFRDLAWVVRPPRRIQELQPKVWRARSELEQQLGRSPRPSEVADRLEVDLEAVIEALSTEGCFAPASLDKPVSDQSQTSIGEQLVSGREDLRAAEARLLLAPLLRGLAERDRLILEMRFVQDATQQEIAAEIGVTQMHVSRLLNRILGQMRKQMEHS